MLPDLQEVGLPLLLCSINLPCRKECDLSLPPVGPRIEPVEHTLLNENPFARFYTETQLTKKRGSTPPLRQT